MGHNWAGWWYVSTPLKNMSLSIGMIVPNIWEDKTCSKPRTRSNLFDFEVLFLRGTGIPCTGKNETRRDSGGKVN